MPRILLADADAFFVAVARAVDSEGAGKAALLIVGGRPGSRGVVCSASYETRAFGVRSAMSIAQALRLCPNAMCVPVPRNACADASRAIRRVLERFTPVVQGASIDEWYLDLSGTEALYHHEPLDTTARRVRAAVLSETGYSLSIGGGSNKLIAKLAAERGKPSRSPQAGGVWIVPDGEELAFMNTVALAEIPGIGPKLQERLHAVGLRTARDVMAQDQATLDRWVGAQTAAMLRDRARGISGAYVEGRDRARQMSREETFSHDISDPAKLVSELRHLAAKVAADMRGDGLSARTITVKLRTNDFETHSAGRTMAESVESDRGVTAPALALLAKLRVAHRKPARLVGVSLSNFGPARKAEQLVMFDVPSPDGELAERDRDRDLSRAVDRVREKFGDDAIRTGPPRRVPIGEKGAKRPRR
ncbi:MAG: Y-family DNA polymerase [Gemmatimonadaceae bacterium]